MVSKMSGGMPIKEIGIVVSTAKTMTLKINRKKNPRNPEDLETVL
jgi:hypothetical protein